MRRILIDHARRRAAKKRSGQKGSLTLEVEPRIDPRSVDLIALDHALLRLAALNPDQARLVELRYFGGLTTQVDFGHGIGGLDRPPRWSATGGQPGSGCTVS